MEARIRHTEKSDLGRWITTTAESLEHAKADLAEIERLLKEAKRSFDQKLVELNNPAKLSCLVVGQLPCTGEKLGHHNRSLAGPRHIKRNKPMSVCRVRIPS
jgi:hypothetical protein